LNFIKSFYSGPLRLLAIVVKTYGANRDWLKAFLERHKKIVPGLIALTAVFWVAILIFANDEDRTRFNSAITDLQSQIAR